MAVKRGRSGQWWAGETRSRSVEVRPTFSASEADLLEHAVRASGWSTGGWVGAVTEAAAGIGPAPVSRSEELAAVCSLLWQLERVGWLSRSLVRRGKPAAGAVVERSDRQVARLAVLAGSVRAAEEDRVIAAARTAIGVADGLGPGWRRAGVRRASPGGMSRDRWRVQVLFEPRSADVVRGLARGAGWPVADLVATVALAAAAELSAAPRGSGSQMDELAERLRTAADRLDGHMEQDDLGRAEAEAVEGVLAMIEDGLSEVEAVLEQLAAQSGRGNVAAQAGDVAVDLRWSGEAGASGR